ncbi:hypothetical protein CWI37_0158p0020 [Hamiltosporidium tvaerminnensis]|uniref:Uncharacterized protein n=1 Tax=Hamiltosporidium tvaerminnensis TaxID=1176355 RepID=A0A4Q9LAF1_9MICR|nr:hypothetical protein LUQ84_002073 [Hamiltosporidium tvaerminnensis]TBU04285.1 hypothetical protein CWI37_0158p0020 [Hamiltosporidium tvaerminnensis]
MFYFPSLSTHIFFHLLYSYIFGAVVYQEGLYPLYMTGNNTTGEETHQIIDGYLDPMAECYTYQATNNINPLYQSHQYQYQYPIPNTAPFLFSFQPYQNGIHPTSVYFLVPSSHCMVYGIPADQQNLPPKLFFPDNYTESPIRANNNFDTVLSYNSNKITIPLLSFDERKKLFKAVLNLDTTKIHSFLPEIRNFLSNDYFFHDFFENNPKIDQVKFIKKNYSTFLKNISWIENVLNIGNFNYSKTNWNIFELVFPNINLFLQGAEILSNFTSLIYLKNFIYYNLISVNQSKRNCITMFIGMKCIESILKLTNDELARLFPRHLKITNAKEYFHAKRTKIKKNSDLIFNIIEQIFSLGLNLNQDFLFVLCIMKIGHNERYKRSFVTRSKSNYYTLDIITDLIFYFNYIDISEIANNCNKDLKNIPNHTKQPTDKKKLIYNVENTFYSQQLLMNSIKYYHMIFQDIQLKFLNTNIENEIIIPNYFILKKKYEYLNLLALNGIDIRRDLHELCYETFYFFHFVMNYCHNHKSCSKDYLEKLKKSFKNYVQ